MLEVFVYQTKFKLDLAGLAKGSGALNCMVINFCRFINMILHCIFSN